MKPAPFLLPLLLRPNVILGPTQEMHFPWLPGQVSMEVLPCGPAALWAFIVFVVTLVQVFP